MSSQALDTRSTGAPVDRFFGKGGRTVVIAEVGQNHDGSLGTAHSYIDAAARAGADAIKFQTHIAAAESTPGEPWRIRFSEQDRDRYAYWKRMEFSEEQWCGLASHARERGLTFISSPFSNEAVDLLERIGVPFWKVGAGEVTNLPMLERMAATRKPVLLSSGMSPWRDVDRATEVLRGAAVPFGVLQCTTMYPCPPERTGLNVMHEIRARYGCPTGLSDHSGKIFAGLAAAALRAEFLEVHVTLSRECFGPDVPASITTDELRTLTQGVKFIHDCLENPVDKDRMADTLADTRRIFGKSIVAAREIAAESRIEFADLAFRKPGSGIPAARYRDLLNRKTRRAVAMNTFFTEDDFE